MLFVVLLVLHLKASQEEVILKICNMLVIEEIDSVLSDQGSRWWIQHNVRTLKNSRFESRTASQSRTGTFATKMGRCAEPISEEKQLLKIEFKKRAQQMSASCNEWSVFQTLCLPNSAILFFRAASRLMSGHGDNVYLGISERNRLQIRYVCNVDMYFPFSIAAAW